MSKREPKNCLECGNLFIRKPQTRQAYCSRKCRQKAYYRRLRRKTLEEARDFGSKKCLECGKIFTLKYANSRPKTCSEKCRLERRHRIQKSRYENRKPRTDFSKGKVFTLDMDKPESEWTWHLEERE